MVLYRNIMKILEYNENSRNVDECRHHFCTGEDSDLVY